MLNGWETKNKKHKTPPNKALTGCFATSREISGIMHPGPSPDRLQPGRTMPGLLTFYRRKLRHKHR
jgi:hypothetical protein